MKNSKSSNWGEWGWLVVNKDGTEYIFEAEPDRCPCWDDPENRTYWDYPDQDYGHCGYIELPKGTIEKLLGRKLTWDDEPVELKSI